MNPKKELLWSLWLIQEFVHQPCQGLLSRFRGSGLEDGDLLEEYFISRIGLWAPI